MLAIPDNIKQRLGIMTRGYDFLKWDKYKPVIIISCKELNRSVHISQEDYDRCRVYEREGDSAVSHKDINSTEQAVVDYCNSIFQKWAEMIAKSKSASGDQQAVKGAPVKDAPAKQASVIQMDQITNGKAVKGDGKGLDKMVGASQLQTTQEKAPAAETQIKDTSNGGDIVRKFVTSNVETINGAYNFTTVFIDTDPEYKKFGVSIPSVALICNDLRKTVASLKRDPLVMRFNKSKTLKRVSEWKKAQVPGIKGTVWVSVYSSAKYYHLNESVDDGDLKYFGFLNEDGSVSRAPQVGEDVTIKGHVYPLVECSDAFVVQNGPYQIRLDECEVCDVVQLDESTMDGQEVAGMVVLGMYNDQVILSDSNDLCYAYGGGSE